MFCLWCVRSPLKDQGDEAASNGAEDLFDQEQESCYDAGNPIGTSSAEKISATSLTKQQPSETASKAIVIEENSYFRRQRKKKMISHSVKQTSAKRRNNASPTSTSCPQLTVEEATESNCSDDETDQKLKPSPSCKSSSGHATSGLSKPSKSSLITKTYSFRRMLSFRSSLRGGGRNGGRSNNSSFEDSTLGSASPGLQPHHRPLQFSFLGQIYKTKSTKRQGQARRYSSQKVSASGLHVHPSENDNDIVRSENVIETAVAILEPSC